MSSVARPFRMVILAGALTCGLGTHALAADIDIRASVDRTQVGLDELLNLTVTVSSSRQAATGEPELDLPAAFALNGTSSSLSTSIQFVNGQMTTTVNQSFVYTLRPMATGSYRIGPARIGTAASNVVEVQVVKGARPSTGGPSAANAGTIQEMEENLFVRALLDKKVVTVGEQVTLAYKLYTRYNIQQLEYSRLPAYTGFWAETMYEASRSPATTREVIDGNTYSVIVLRRVALFPTTAGRHPLEQMEIRCEIPVRRRGRSPLDLDDFFSFDPFGRSQQVLVRSEDVALDVKPLPSPAPPEFGGAVGSYEIEAVAKPTETKAGDPIAVTVSVTGTGHLNSVSAPRYADDGEFKFYNPKTTTTPETGVGRFGGTKTFEYVVIPRKSGKVALPTFSLTYFDPDSLAYRTVRSGTIGLSILPGDVAAAPAAGLNRQDIRRLGEDIRYIKPDAERLDDHARAGSIGWTFLVLQVIPVAGFFAAFGLRRHQDRLAGDVAYARRRRSQAEARRRLGEAQRLMQGEDPRAFYAEVHRAAAEFLGDRLNLPAAGLTTESAGTALSSRGVSDDLVTRLRMVMQTCEFGRFAPSGSGDDRRLDLYAEAEALIGDLGRVI